MAGGAAQTETLSFDVASFVPPHVPKELIHDFDVYNSRLLDDDPQAGFKHLQQSHPPLFYTPRLGGLWVLTDPDLIHEAVHDTARFSTRTLQVPKAASMPIPLVPTELDPPEHEKYRRLLNAPFSPKAVAELESGLRAAAIAMIEDLRPRGGCDFVAEFARRFPVQAFLLLYGLPIKNADQLLKWLHMAHHELTLEARMEGINQLYAYLDEIVAERRAHPTNDLVTALVRADIDGKPMRPEMLRSMLYLVLVAGLDTVTESLSFSMRFLAQNPGHQKQLRDDPANIPYAVEELLRRFGPLWMSRLAKYDFTFAGQEIKFDEQILMPQLLIGMDERAVKNPLIVDFARRNFRNTAFGLGIHRCAGSHLARLEMKLFFEEWMKRIPAFAITPGTKPRVGVGVTVNYMENLDLIWPVSG